MNIKYTLPKTAKALNTIIAEAIMSAQTMKEKVQIAAVAIAHHAFKTGDYRGANDLIEGLGHGVKRDSLVEWFITYVGLTISDEGNEFDGWQGKEFIAEQFTSAKATFWYDLKKANPFAGFDLDKELLKLVKKANKTTKHIRNHPEDMDKVDTQVSAATLKQVMTLLDTGEQLEHNKAA